MKIISLKEAKALCLKRYYTGKPCKHGHLCERKVSDRSCVECNLQKSRRHAHKAIQWHHDNKEKVQARLHQYYEDHKDIIKTQAREWGINNHTRLRELQNNWRRSPKGLEQSRNWVDANREKHAICAKNWKDEHLELVYEYTGTRRAAKLNATPPWLTREDRAEIRATYAEAKRIERETGKKQHVDHIIPLQGEFVCGLHVPWNLQILSESDNASKGNRFNT